MEEVCKVQPCPPLLYLPLCQNSQPFSCSRLVGSKASAVTWRQINCQRTKPTVFTQNKDLMAMDMIFVTLAYCLLAFSSTLVQTENTAIPSLTTTKTTTSTTAAATMTTTSGLNLTQETTALSGSTVNPTVTSNSTEYVTQSTSKNLDNVTFTGTTVAITESTSHALTSQSVTNLTPLTNSTPLQTTAPSTQRQTSTSLTEHTIQSTTGGTNTPDIPAITTSSHTINTISDSGNKTTQGLGLNVSDQNMTIVLSVFLGVFALALVMFMFLKCKHKLQYLHQPLSNTDNFGATVAEDDTLVISGGLYDGHPIYDNVPPAREDQSQFRLEFLH